LNTRMLPLRSVAITVRLTFLAIPI
jgi:hypothetical protein